MRTALALSLALVFACSGKGSDSKQKKEPAPRSAPTPSDGGKVESKENPDDNKDALCGCRMLTKHGLDNLLDGGHEKACGGDKLLADADCGDYDMLRNCIYAAHGNEFKTKKWRTHFAKMEWYTPRPDFKETEITKLERANIKLLKTRAALCRAKSGGKATSADIKLVKKWFKTKKLPPIVWSEMGDGPYDPASIEGRLYWKLNAKTTYSYSRVPQSSELAARLKGKKYRTIEVANCDECADDQPDCEVSCDTFELMLGKKNEVVAVDVTATAACPFVYASRAGEPMTLRGEILRNLSEPGLEGTQRLGLDDLDCGSTINVQLAEHKYETTLLDEVYLEVDGRRIDAQNCDGSHCENDGVYTQLHQGDALDLVFDVAGETCDKVALVADGYYLPL